MTPELKFEDVAAVLRADFETGKLYWKERPVESFQDERMARLWNGQHAGKEAFTSTHCQGYLCGGIKNRKYLAHRVIWLLATGAWPKGQIDHINGERQDNRPCNLRDVSQAINGKNAKMSASNNSGVVGVHWYAKRSRWRVKIGVGGKDLELGTFRRFEDAVACRKAAEASLGYHKNHGRTS